MNIQLPPVAQVVTASTVSTSGGNHLTTLHHRNRSLDSALQRIPEASPECEVGTPSSIIPPTTVALHPIIHHHPPSSTTTKPHRDELASLGSDDSGICGSETGSTDTTATRESSVEFPDSGSETELRTQQQQNVVVNQCCQSGSSSSNTEVVNITTTNRVTHVSVISERPKPSTGLLRLLESRVFDVSMAVHYLFKSKEAGVQSYIVNRMFSFDDVDVDFYLPQLVCMYIQMQDVAEVLHPYLLKR